MRTLVFILFALPLLRAEVRVWQGTLTLPTYEEGRPIPIRHSIVIDQRFNYPYTIENKSDRRGGRPRLARRLSLRTST